MRGFMSYFWVYFPNLFFFRNRLLWLLLGLLRFRRNFHFSSVTQSCSTLCDPRSHQVSLSISNSRSLPKLMSIESVLPSNHLILSSPSPPAFNLSQHQGSFPMSQLFVSGGQSIGVSASTSVLPMNTQDWSLGWTGWTSLQSKGLSRVFSNTTVQKHQFFCTQLSLYSNSHIYTWLMEKA